jgi:hypothetical protein
VRQNPKGVPPGRTSVYIRLSFALNVERCVRASA